MKILITIKELTALLVELKDQIAIGLLFIYIVTAIAANWQEALLLN